MTRALAVENGKIDRFYLEKGKKKGVLVDCIS